MAQNLEQLGEEWINDQNSPSLSYIFFNNNDITFSLYRGWRDIAGSKPANQFTVYPILSITKVFTALAIAKLVTHGKINTEGFVNDYLHEIPWLNKVKIKHLLIHLA